MQKRQAMIESCRRGWDTAVFRNALKSVSNKNSRRQLSASFSHANIASEVVSPSRDMSVRYAQIISDRRTKIIHLYSSLDVHLNYAFYHLLKCHFRMFSTITSSLISIEMLCAGFHLWARKIQNTLELHLSDPTGTKHRSDNQRLG